MPLGESAICLLSCQAFWDSSSPAGAAALRLQFRNELEKLSPTNCNRSTHDTTSKQLKQIGKMSHECLVCGDQEGETTLLELGCRNHHVCMNPDSQCLGATFSNAISNEQSYPVKCCNDVLLIDDYQEFIPDLIPFDVYMTFKEKEQEYATHPR